MTRITQRVSGSKRENFLRVTLKLTLGLQNNIVACSCLTQAVVIHYFIHYFTTRDLVDFLDSSEVVVACSILLQDRSAQLIGSRRLLIAYPYIESRVACPLHP
jgi:hypothetical protein